MKKISIYLLSICLCSFSHANQSCMIDELTDNRAKGAKMGDLFENGEVLITPKYKGNGYVVWNVSNPKFIEFQQISDGVSKLGMTTSFYKINETSFALNDGEGNIVIYGKRGNQYKEVSKCDLGDVGKRKVVSNELTHEEISDNEINSDAVQINGINVTEQDFIKFDIRSIGYQNKRFYALYSDGAFSTWERQGNKCIKINETVNEKWSNASGMIVKNEKAYVAINNKNHGLAVLNIKNPNNVKTIGFMKTKGHPHFIISKGNAFFMFVGDKAGDSGNISIIDARKPNNPKIFKKIPIENHGYPSHINFDAKGLLWTSMLSDGVLLGVDVKKLKKIKHNHKLETGISGMIANNGSMFVVNSTKNKISVLNEKCVNGVI